MNVGRSLACNKKPEVKPLSLLPGQGWHGGAGSRAGWGSTASPPSGILGCSKPTEDGALGSMQDVFYFPSVQTAWGGVFSSCNSRGKEAGLYLRHSVGFGCAGIVPRECPPSPGSATTAEQGRQHQTERGHRDRLNSETSPAQHPCGKGNSAGSCLPPATRRKGMLAGMTPYLLFITRFPGYC